LTPTAPKQTGSLPSPSFLCLLSSQEVENLRLWVTRGELPGDFEAKLQQLTKGSLLHQTLEQNCRLFFALLVAVAGKAFTQILPAQRERLERVLAYVRKDDDANPDYKPDGFWDDQKEVRAALLELADVLKEFKAWRLQHQVPSLWLKA